MSFLVGQLGIKKSALSLQTRFSNNIHINHIHINPFFLITPNHRKKEFPKERNFPRKRISFGTSLNNKGSLTVEAALVVPFFVFAIISILSFCEILRLQMKIDSALVEQTKTLAIYSYGKEAAANYLSESGSGGSHADGDMNLGGVGGLLSDVYVYNKVTSEIGKDTLQNSPLGKNGKLSFLGSHYTDDRIEIHCNYFVTPFFSLSPKAGFLTGETAVAKVFNGYDNSKSFGGNHENEARVYITDHGTVYHKSLDCHYLDLSISSTDVGAVKNLRNEEGSKYKPCPLCKDKTITSVYITKYGECYHTDLSCSGLKRTIQSVSESEVHDMKACSKCGG